jgi:hypothetical protein
MANTEFVGKKLNVESRKGVHQETILKQLNTKGIVRTEEGNEYNIADLRKKGRGLFVTAAGAGKAKAGSAAPAENSRKPAERTATAVTLDEIDGRKIDGLAVVKVARRTGMITLEDGSVVEIANVSRKGRGYVTEGAAAPAPKVAGGARAKAKPADAGSTVTNADIRPAVKAGGLKIRIDGKLHTIVSTVTGEKFKTDKGYKGETGEIRNVGGKYVLETAEYKAANAPAPTPAAKAADAKPSRAPAPIKRADLKGKNIAVGDVTHVVEKTFKDDTVETNKGFRFSVADVARKGRGFIYTGELSEKKGGAVPRQRPAPEPVSQIVEVGAFDYDTVADVRDLLEKAVRAALADAYDVDVSGSLVQYEDQIATISFQIHTADAPAALVKSKIEAFRANMEEQASGTPAPKGNPKAKLNGDDFNPSELADEDDEDDEEEDAPNPVVASDDDDADFPDEDDSDADDADDEDESEDDADFPDEEPAEIAFPEDATQLVESGVGRLSKLFPTKTMTGFVTRWYASQEAFDAVEYEIEPGMTIVIDGEDYALGGLKPDGSVLLVNVKTAAARSNVDLDALQILVEEDKRGE